MSQWNLARVSCVPDSVEVRGYALSSETDGRYAYGFMDNPRLANQIINALCRADGVTAEAVADGAEPHYLLDISLDAKIECQDRILRGELSVLQCNGTPLAYIMTKNDITDKLLIILNEMRISV
jgi:hypothetical protein